MKILHPKILLFVSLFVLLILSEGRASDDGAISLVELSSVSKGSSKGKVYLKREGCEKEGEESIATGTPKQESASSQLSSEDVLLEGMEDTTSSPSDNQALEKLVNAFEGRTEPKQLRVFLELLASPKETSLPLVEEKLADSLIRTSLAWSAKKIFVVYTNFLGNPKVQNELQIKGCDVCMVGLYHEFLLQERQYDGVSVSLPEPLSPLRPEGTKEKDRKDKRRGAIFLS